MDVNETIAQCNDEPLSEDYVAQTSPQVDRFVVRRASKYKALSLETLIQNKNTVVIDDERLTVITGREVIRARHPTETVTAQATTILENTPSRSMMQTRWSVLFQPWQMM